MTNRELASDEAFERAVGAFSKWIMLSKAPLPLARLAIRRLKDGRGQI